MPENKFNSPEYKSGVTAKLENWLKTDPKALERAHKGLVELRSLFRLMEEAEFGRVEKDSDEPTSGEIAAVLLDLKKVKMKLKGLGETLPAGAGVEILEEINEMIKKIDVDKKNLRDINEWMKVAKLNVEAAIKLLEKYTKTK